MTILSMATGRYVPSRLPQVHLRSEELACVLPRTNWAAMTKPLEAAFSPADVKTRKGRTFWVRQYTVDDFEALVEMYKRFKPKRVAQGLPPPDLRRIAHWLDRLQHKSAALVALDGKKIVGHAILCPISDASVEFTVFVHHDFRREGLGAALTRLAMDLARQAGFAELFLTTELSNLAALRLYNRAGFKIISRFGNECEMKLIIARSEREQADAA